MTAFVTAPSAARPAIVERSHRTPGRFRDVTRFRKAPAATPAEEYNFSAVDESDASDDDAGLYGPPTAWNRTLSGVTGDSVGGSLPG